MNEQESKPWDHCWQCEDYKKCPYADKFQRLPRERNGLGLCKKIKKK